MAVEAGARGVAVDRRHHRHPLPHRVRGAVGPARPALLCRRQAGRRRWHLGADRGALAGRRLHAAVLHRQPDRHQPVRVRQRALRHRPRFRSGRAPRVGTVRDPGAREPAGTLDAGAGRLHPRPSRQGDLRQRVARQPGASRRRAVAAEDRRPRRDGALPQRAADHPGSVERRDGCVRGADRRGEGGHRRRQDPRPRRDHGEAARSLARCTDAGRAGLSGLRRGRLVRRPRAQRHAAADRRQAQSRAQCGDHEPGLSRARDRHGGRRGRTADP